jgi:hypothetical protein
LILEFAQKGKHAVTQRALPLALRFKNNQ